MSSAAGVGAQWTFLSDPGRKVQKDLDIAEYTDPDHNPMIPHTAGARARPACLQDLQRLLVLRPADRGGAAPRPARRAAAVPARLGHQQRGAADSVGERRQGEVSIRTEKRRHRCSPNRTKGASRPDGGLGTDTKVLRTIAPDTSILLVAVATRPATAGSPDVCRCATLCGRSTSELHGDAHDDEKTRLRPKKSRGCVIASTIWSVSWRCRPSGLSPSRLKS